MIKRTYFISAQCHKGDGSMSYSHFSTTACLVSWRPKPNLVFKDMASEAEKQFIEKGLPAASMQVVSFNRV
jgi:hypothetical protein